jgi:hypothetical protein
MKVKGTTLLLIVLLLVLLPITAVADKPVSHDGNGVENAWDEAASIGCTRIQDGTLTTSDGELLTTGFSEWGYNYQAHLFNGMYCDYHPLYRPGGPYYDWCQAYYGNVDLLMKWNDAWLSNVDCDGDGLLDRHYGFDTYIGSGAWTTNHMWGSYEDEGGNTCNWDYFVKIVAAPEDATLSDGVWYNADGVEIGPEIWGEFATIQEIENDPCAGISGVQYSSPDHPGLGGW